MAVSQRDEALRITPPTIKCNGLVAKLRELNTAARERYAREALKERLKQHDDPKEKSA